MYVMVRPEAPYARCLDIDGGPHTPDVLDSEPLLL